MTWISSTPGATALESALGHRPELLARYKALYGTFWEDGLVPRRTLELCRLRIAAIHDCDAEWCVRDAQVQLDDADQERLRRGREDGFDPEERAALALAERIPFSHHEITDEQVESVRGWLGDAGAVSLLTALAFFDVSCRLRLLLEVSAQPVELQAPPTHDGALA